MRIVLDSDEASSSSSSDIEYILPSRAAHLRNAPKVSTLGRSIQAVLVDSSDSDSDDAVEGMLGRRVATRKPRAVTESPKQTPFSPAKPLATPARKPTGQKPAAVSTSRRPRPSATLASPARESPQSLRKKAEWDLLGADEHAAWMKGMEQESMDAGNQASLARLAELRREQAAVAARLAQSEEQRLSAARSAFEERLRAVRASYARAEEAGAARRRARSNRLSQVVDASIAEATRRFAEIKVQAEAEERARKERAEREEREKAERASRERDEAEAEKKRRAEAEARAKADEAEAAAERERAAAAEGAARAKADEAAKAAAAQTAAAGAPAREWEDWVDRQRRFKADVIEAVKADGAMSDAVRKGARLMTRKIGQVVNTRRDVLRVAADVGEILDAHLPAPPTALAPTALASVPKTHAYLLSHLAKALIRQAETEVAAKPDAAFPLGRIVVLLLVRGHAALADVLFARLVKKCPWVLPYFPPQTPGQSKEAYFKTIGRRPAEPLAGYIDRSAAILALYFAVLQTPPQSVWPGAFDAPPGLTPARLPALVPPPLRFPAAWTWLAHATREPVRRTPLAARLLSVYLAFCAPQLVRTYGRQADKALAMLGSAVAGDAVASDAPAEAARLRIALDDWHASGALPEHKARDWEDV